MNFYLIFIKLISYLLWLFINIIIVILNPKTYQMCLLILFDEHIIVLLITIIFITYILFYCMNKSEPQAENELVQAELQRANERSAELRSSTYKSVKHLTRVIAFGIQLIGSVIILLVVSNLKYYYMALIICIFIIITILMVIINNSINSISLTTMNVLITLSGMASAQDEKELKAVTRRFNTAGNLNYDEETNVIVNATNIIGEFY